MLKPSTTTVGPVPLEVITLTTVSLYLLAKAYHLNVTGPSFYGDHKTYDGVADVAIEWFDKLAERMRALQQPMNPTLTRVASISVLDEADISLDAEGMRKDMVAALEAFREYIVDKLGTFDDVTGNQLQELAYDLDRQAYFVRSSK